jgi:hypothetical protein
MPGIILITAGTYDALWSAILAWIGDYRIGDLASIAGVVISVIGFAATVTGVIKSKNAAQRAEEAARATRENIRLLDTVVDFAAAIALLEEIKRLHRTSQWALVPDRCAAIRKLLITLRASNSDLTDRQQTVIQAALTNLLDIEFAIERASANTETLRPAKFNAVLSQDIDQLLAIFVELKSSKS